MARLGISFVTRMTSKRSKFDLLLGLRFTLIQKEGPMVQFMSKFFWFLHALRMIKIKNIVELMG